MLQKLKALTRRLRGEFSRQKQQFAEKRAAFWIKIGLGTSAVPASIVLFWEHARELVDAVVNGAWLLALSLTVFIAWTVLYEGSGISKAIQIALAALAAIFGTASLWASKGSEFARRVSEAMRDYLDGTNGPPSS